MTAEAPGTGGGRRRPWPALVVALLFVAAPAVFWSGGVVEEEAVGFLRHHWSDLSFAQKVFDPGGWDDYQGRELSYAFDWADAQWVRLLLEHDRPLFVPPSAVLALLAMVGAFWWGVPRVFPRLDRLASWSILLLYLSGFAALSTTGILYRATKPLVAPLLLGLLLFVLAVHRSAEPPRPRSFWIVLALGTTMGLLDRQGLFYILCVTGVLGAAFVATRRGGFLVAGGIGAVLLVLLYNYVLGPRLIFFFNGYWPSLRFQHPSPWWLLDPAAWREGLSVLGDWTTALYGGLPAGVVVVVAAGLAAWAWLPVRPRPHPLVPTLVVVAVVAQAAMVTLMVRRHEPVTWIDHRVWYYPLPYQALLLFLMLWALDRIVVVRGRVPWAVPVVTLGLVAANVAGWPGMRRVMESGPWFGDVSRRSALLEESLRTGVPSPRLDGDYRRFLFECRDRFPRIAARMGAHVSEGNGVGMTRLDGDRLVASAERESRFVAYAPAAGRYRLEGSLRLRPRQAVLVALDTVPPRALGEVSPGDGAPLTSFAWELELPRGETGILLRSVRAASGPRHRGRPLAFRLQLPFRLVPVGG